MLTNVQIGILLTIVFAAIGVLAWIVEILLTLHASRIISIQKRSDEFITLSRNYYLPLAYLTGGIQAETDPKYTLRPRKLFFKLAKFSNLSYKFSENEGGIWLFPKETQETKVSNYAENFYNNILSFSIFNDEEGTIERVINYYKSYSDFLNFVEDIENLPEYKRFKSNFDNKSKRYLFTWDNVSSDDNKELRRFLIDAFGIDWAETANIIKPTGRTINISKDDNSAEIKVDGKKKKATLKISGGRTHELKVKTEDDKLIICNKTIKEELFETSREFREAIYEGVTEEYKVWYKFELKKFFGWLKEKTYIDKILNKLYKNKK